MKEILFWLLGLIGIGVVAHEATKSYTDNPDKPQKQNQAGNYESGKDNK